MKVASASSLSAPAAGMLSKILGSARLCPVPGEHSRRVCRRPHPPKDLDEDYEWLHCAARSTGPSELGS